MNEFLLNCLKEITTHINAIQVAIIAYIGYAEGLSAFEENQTVQTSNNELILQDKTNISEIKDCIGISENVEFTFTQQELAKMPLQFRKEYRIDGTVVRCRKRPTGLNKHTYEMRYRRDGYNVTATAKTLEECKAKFLEKLKEADKQTKKQETETLFKNFALYYFETFKKRKVAEATYKADCSRLNNLILPHFGNKDLKAITPGECQAFIDSLIKQGKGKSAEEVHSLLNQIFKGAIKHGYLTQNPLDLVIRTKHEREHGTALTLEKEAQFVKMLEGDKYAPLFITALYTGMRPNEYEHAEFKDGFLVTINSKRKNKKVEYKKIPLHPMLEPYVTNNFIKDFNELKKIEINTLRRYFCRNFANIASKLYDLRTTFYTRCEMCGVSEPARNEFVGHSGGTLKDTYTDLPDSYLIKEAQKIRYNLEF